MAVNTAAPQWFKWAAWAALLWSLLGVASYLMDVTTSPEALAKLPEAQQELYANRPAWIVGVYAVSVFSALAGAIALLLGKNWARPALALSLASVIVQFFSIIFVFNLIALIGWSATIFPAVIVILGAAMLWLAQTGSKKGWLQ
ncbi:MAG: hypothetical protein R3C60_07110 [Parvularculaceae bacterium]